MGRKCVGLIEAIGLASAIQAADTAVKTAKWVGKWKQKGTYIYE